MISQEEAELIAQKFCNENVHHECKVDGSRFLEAKTYDGGINVPAVWVVDVSVPETITHRHGRAPEIHPQRTIMIAVDQITKRPSIIPTL